MSLRYTKKTLVELNHNDEFILDGQSGICNWLYNKLLETCTDDYKNNNNALHLLSGRNLRDYATTLKETFPFLRTVHSSPLKEVSTRLKLAYDGFFRGDRGHPNYRSQKKKWFSLVYDEPDKGWELRNDGKEIALALGKIPDMPKEKGCANPYVVGKLSEKIELQPGELLKTFSLVKQGGKFYAIFSIEKCSSEELDFKAKMSEYRKACNEAKKTNSEKPNKPQLEVKEGEIPKDCKWIAIDPNHENFFMSIDYEGNKIRFEKLDMIKYWDKVIDKLKAKRDVCQKSYRKHKTKNGSSYTVHSPRYNRINKALEHACAARREQIKSALYSIAHILYEMYDLVMIGDYVPDNNTAKYKNMKRSMLNQEEIGQFRTTLKWVAQKLGKYYIMVDEHNTTKKCCVCGHEESKEPSIREYVCPKCGTHTLRDVNSAVNIAKKMGYMLDMTIYKDDLNTITFIGSVKYSRKATLKPV